MFRVLLTVLLIVCVSVLLALGPGALKPYHIQDALPLAAGALSIALFASALWVGARVFSFLKHCEFIGDCLTTTETEMNNLLRGLDQSGRMKRVEELQSWAKLLHPHPLVLAHTDYKTPLVDDLFAASEKALSGSKDAGRAINQTALLFRDVVTGQITGAQLRISAIYRNTGKLPYVAPGIAELVHLHEFDPQTAKFPKGSGENGWLVRRVAKWHGVPQKLMLVVDDKKTGSSMVYMGMEVLNRLTALNA